MQDFVNAEDWDATRPVVEAQQALLFQPEVETLFEGLGEGLTGVYAQTWQAIVEQL